MLKDDFYWLISFDKNDTVLNALLELNADHKIFSGHFPGTPVVPGVCMLQMVKEVLEMDFDKPLSIIKADFMKFLVVIDPRINRMVKINILYKIIEDNSFETTATLNIEDKVCFKFKGSFLLG